MIVMTAIDEIDSIAVSDQHLCIYMVCDGKNDYIQFGCRIIAATDITAPFLDKFY